MADETVPRDSAWTSLTLPSLAIRVVEGPDAVTERVTGRRSFTVGTGEDNDVVLTDRSVSRHHLSFEAGPDSIVVRDLDSTNGTTMDGVRIVVAIAEPGRRLRIGATTLELAAAHSPLSIPLSDRDRFGGLVGKSVAMRELYAVLERGAESDASVLLSGETGTGKELAAEAIHEASPRRDGPFVVVDCGAIPPALFESELFGHVRGAFTGAVRDQKGLLVEAHGGTIFLDEIGELPPEAQPKLLRALERRTVRPVGATKPVSIDVRVVAATHRDLSAEVNRGGFREDLYFRLAVLRIQLPPLRDRMSDLPELVRLFVERIAPEQVGECDAIVRALRHRSFPGNVRELRNAVEELLVLGGLGLGHGLPGPATDLSGGFPDQLFDLSYKEASDAALALFQRGYVARLLEKNEGNVSRAARDADMSRRYLQTLIQRLDIDASDG